MLRAIYLAGVTFVLLSALAARAAGGDLWTFNLSSIEPTASSMGMWAAPDTIGQGIVCNCGPEPYNPVHGALFSYLAKGRIVVWRDTLFIFYDLNAADEASGSLEFSIAEE